MATSFPGKGGAETFQGASPPSEGSPRRARESGTGRERRRGTAARRGCAFAGCYREASTRSSAVSRARAAVTVPRAPPASRRRESRRRSPRHLFLQEVPGLGAGDGRVGQERVDALEDAAEHRVPVSPHDGRRAAERLRPRLAAPRAPESRGAPASPAPCARAHSGAPFARRSRSTQRYARPTSPRTLAAIALREAHAPRGEEQPAKGERRSPRAASRSGGTAVGRKPGFGGPSTVLSTTSPATAARALRRGQRADGPAPVLHHEDEALEPQRVDERADGAAVKVQRVHAPVARVVREPEADEVGHHQAQGLARPAPPPPSARGSPRSGSRGAAAPAGPRPAPSRASQSRRRRPSRGERGAGARARRAAAVEGGRSRARDATGTARPDGEGARRSTLRGAQSRAVPLDAPLRPRPRLPGLRLRPHHPRPEGAHARHRVQAEGLPGAQGRRGAALLRRRRLGHRVGADLRPHRAVLHRPRPLDAGRLEGLPRGARDARRSSWCARASRARRWPRPRRCSSGTGTSITPATCRPSSARAASPASPCSSPTAPPSTCSRRSPTASPASRPSTTARARTTPPSLPGAQRAHHADPPLARAARAPRRPRRRGLRRLRQGAPEDAPRHRRGLQDRQHLGLPHRPARRRGEGRLPHPLRRRRRLAAPRHRARDAVRRAPGRRAHRLRRRLRARRRLPRGRALAPRRAATCSPRTGRTSSSPTASR